MTRALGILILLGAVGLLFGWWRGNPSGERLVDLAGVSYRVDRLAERVRRDEGSQATPSTSTGLLIRLANVERAVVALRVALDTLVTISPPPRHREHVPAIDGVVVGRSYVPREADGGKDPTP